MASPPTSTPPHQITDDENWMRLSLVIRKHGTQSIRDMLVIILYVPTDGKLFHSWVATAKLNRKCKIIPCFVWRMLLGSCKDGCIHPCNRETNMDDLDITTLIQIYNHAEYIIPPYILPRADIINLKLKYEIPVKSILTTRNELAHYSFKKMSEPEFDDQWIKIRDALVAMGYNKITLVDGLKTDSLDPEFNNTVRILSDNIQILENEKCDKKEFENLKLIVDSLIQTNAENKVEFEELHGVKKGIYTYEN